jgi:3'(2'), 5'-bisphosphate nucleotidase
MNSNLGVFTQWLGPVIDIARRAGAEILEVYESGDIAVAAKSDSSPLTQADLRAHQTIVDALHAMTPEWPVLSEESSKIDYAERAQWSRYWLVDPLDGTKEFISRNGEFTVNIALIENGCPTLGVVLAPALSRLFAGAEGVGAFLEENSQRRPIACRAVPAAGLTVVASRSHGDAEALDRFLAGRKVASKTNAGSSLKLCLVAAGEADLYPRLGRTMEWDIAAGDAVLRAAGGVVNTLAGEPLVYGKPDFANPHFAARGLQQAATAPGKLAPQT